MLIAEENNQDENIDTSSTVWNKMEHKKKNYLKLICHLCLIEIS